MGRKAKDFKWENLKGSVLIGGRKGGSALYDAEYVLKKNGLNPKEDLVVDTSVQFALMAGAFTGARRLCNLFEPSQHLC